MLGAITPSTQLVRNNQNYMAEKEVKTPKSERQARWEAYVENYAKKNPVKHAAKKANGEFDTIPASFK